MAAAAEAGDSTDHKAVVLLFLSGGPTQLETWDPKPDAPQEYRTLVDTIPTALPGVQFSKYFPKMAADAKNLAVIRSFASGNGGHTYESVTTGGNKAKAAMSAMVMTALFSCSVIGVSVCRSCRAGHCDYRCGTASIAMSCCFILWRTDSARLTSLRWMPDMI